MNIIAQCCGIVLLLVILYFYRRQKNIRLGTGKAFWRALCVTLACITLDIMSIIAIDNMKQLPQLLVDLVCKSYLVSLIGVSFCSLAYVCVDIYTGRKKQYKKTLYRFVAVVAVGVGIVYSLPLYYYMENDQQVVYTYGPSVLATYAMALFFIAVTIYITIRFKERLNPRRREAVLIWLLFWMTASLIQFFNNELLIVGYATSVGIMVLYLELENPETNIDKRTGLFNQGALVQYMRQLFGEHKSFAALVLVLEHSMSKGLPTEKEAVARLESDAFLATIPGASVFKNGEDETVLLFLKPEDEKKARKLIHEYFASEWKENVDYFMPPSWIYIPDCNVVQGVEDVLYFIRHTRQNSREFLENNYLCIDEKVVEALKKEKEVEQLILDAMEQGRVEVYYQPIYSTKEKCFTSAEALVRIRDEDGGIVPPGVFIDIAEQNGMILRLGEIIFEQVCCFLKNNDLERYGIHYIEINLSVVQCAYEQLAENYIRIMKKYEIRPELINLEITESASLKAKKVLLDNMKILMDYGIRFSLDDFGTGQSNLNYIIDMPVDIVKFDRIMSNAYFENGKAKYVMDAAMHMIHGLELEIVSEGIETEEQYQAMEQLGISYIQGYYFSKPLAGRDFLEFLRMNAV